MSKLLSFAFLGLMLSVLPTAIAADEKTITGEAVCAKCALGETKECQNVVTVKDGDKTTTYYLTGDASDKGHKDLGICGAKKGKGIKVKVTGTETEEDGKKSIEVTKIEKAE